MFVGRSAELETIGAAVGQAAHGGVSAVLVNGEPGSGKTRLLAEAERAAPVAACYHVLGYEAERAVPLASAAGLLRELGVAAELLVEPRAAEPDALEPLRVFEAVHRSLRSPGSALLVVDDLQWVDELSRALVHYVVRGARTEGRPLAVLAASRPDSAARAFAESLTHAVPGDRVVALELGPLDQEDGIRLARTLAPGIDDELAAEIWERSGGVPFWLEALAGSGGATADVERVVESRLRGLDADSVTALALLVVASRPLSPTAVAEIEGWAPERVDRAVSQLVSSGAVTSRGPVVQLVHDLLRETALAELPDDLRRDVHVRLAHWLELRGDRIQSLREALEHRLEAGLPVLELLVRIVEHPRRRLLGREGLLEIQRISDAATDERPLALDVGTASLASELGEYQLAEDRWSAVSELTGERARAARAALEASRAAYLRDRSVAAWKLVRRARALCSDETLEIEVDAHEAAIRRWLDHDVEGGDRLATHAFAEADALVGRAGGVEGLDREQLSAVHEALSAAVDGALVANDVDRGLPLADRLVEVAHRLGEERRLQALLKRANMLGVAGRLDEDEEDLRLVWSTARERILPTVEIEAGFSLAMRLLGTGRLEEAELLADEAAALSERSGPSRMVATPWRLQRVPLLVRLVRGEWREALHGLRAAAEDDRDPHRRLHVQQTIGTWLARVDPERSVAEVHTRFLAAQADADAARCRRCRGEVDVRAAEAFARVGLLEEARAVVGEWDVRHPSPGVRERIWRAQAEAALAAAAGDVDRAVALLEPLVSDAEALRMRLEAVWVALDLGAVLSTADRARAVDVLRDAAQRAEEMGAGTQKAIALQRLRALGVRTWRRRPGASVLTDRELEIARLVATGASNLEIAQALFLSRKTIERHVSNALRKLGARNRAELAARLAESAAGAEGAHR